MLICQLCFKGLYMGCFTSPLEEILVRKCVCLYAQNKLGFFLIEIIGNILNF
jgi:hypothetical protein